ncbi:hypothetical protein M5689_003302 [Euphorbia peplus]|nr:hypothetical protein M5689_003302 [Euphorbia peplus]
MIIQANKEQSEKEEREDGQLAFSKKEPSKKVKQGHVKGNFIPPMSLARVLKMNKQQHDVAVGNKELGVAEKVSSNKKHTYQFSGNHEGAEGIHNLDEAQFGLNLEGTDLDEDIDNQEYSLFRDNMGSNYDQERQTEERVILGDNSLHDLDDESMNNANMEVELKVAGIVKKKRGIVYSRKLTTLPPGEKIVVEFDEDVKDWEDFTPETLDHLWACILEKCNFGKDSVMQHARLDCWSSDDFKEKSIKASTSRSFQKMPHYNGAKSFARFRQEIKEKNGGKCTRLDVMVESRKRKSKKLVNADTLAHNMQEIDEMKKLKEQREQGINQKTDEQIFQDVLGKDTHGYLRAYGPGRSITKHFEVKPSQIDLAQEVDEVKKNVEEPVLEARKDVEDARKEAEDAKKEAEEARKDTEYAKNEAKEIRNEVDRKLDANNQVW